MVNYSQIWYYNNVRKNSARYFSQQKIKFCKSLELSSNEAEEWTCPFLFGQEEYLALHKSSKSERLSPIYLAYAHTFIFLRRKMYYAYR